MRRVDEVIPRNVQWWFQSTSAVQSYTLYFFLLQNSHLLIPSL